jgi:signal transduction histidine kinase
VTATSAPALSLPSRRRRLSRRLAALALAGIAAGGAIAALGATSDHLDLRALSVTLLVANGWGFIGVGLYAWWRRPENRFGALMVLAGFLSFVAALAVSDIPLAFTLGAALSVLYLAVIVHLLLAFPSGRLEAKSDRDLVIGTYVVATVVVIPSFLFTDFQSHDCDDCPNNVLLVENSETAVNVIDVLTSLAGIVLVFELGRTLWRRWRDAAPRQRHALAPVLVAGVIASVALGVALAGELVGITPVADLFELVGVVGIAAVPWCFLVGLVRSAATRVGAVGGVVGSLGASSRPDEVRQTLADGLGDPTLALAFWIPETGGYVDDEGREFALPDQLERGITPVELDGRRVAALIHDPALLDEPELVRAVADAAALALERARLDAELRAKLEELRASRTRIVEAGYAAARRLERDLHDGAQQRLVSLALELRMVEDRMADDPSEAARLLADAREELGQVMDELRDFARGLHPGVLSTRGLDAALEALAARAPLPVEVRGRLDERLPERVEAAAYYVVAEALTNVAKYAEAERAWIEVARLNGDLVVEVGDDGRGGADPAAGTGLRGLRDRLAALDGSLEVESARGGGTRVRAAIPCGAG